jgi:lambda family phage portal protein
MAYRISRIPNAPVAPGRGLALPSPGGRPRHLAGLQGGLQGAAFPYDAAAITTPEFGEWLPSIRGPDMEINYWRDRMVARSRDLVRNDGWCSGSITRILDSLLGGSYRLACMPDYRFLARQGGPSYDAVWAEEFRQFVEGEWRAWSEDIGHWNDATGEMTVTQQFRQFLWHYLVDGDGFAVCYSLPDQIGRGAAKYATSWQVIDPDRLSNPNNMVDQKHLRGGVELNERGRPIAYHVRKAEQNSWYEAVESVTWERIERDDPDGWQRAIHHHSRERAGQHRGLGIFLPVLGRLKMLAKYYGTELQAAAIASTFGTYITSPFDPQLVESALDAGSDGAGEAWSYYQGIRSDFHEQHRPQLNGATIPTLAPGEKIETVSAERPNSAFSDFTHEMLRGVASCINVSYEQLTQDYSETNYSSARAAVAETERSIRRRLAEFNSGCANKVYANFLQEVFEQGKVPLPRGAVDFLDARTAYARCLWRGPGAGLIDGLKERQATGLGLDLGLTTLQEAVAGESGADWQEVLEQRAIELAKCKELGLPPPSWSAPPPGSGGTDDDEGKGKNATPTPPQAK